MATLTMKQTASVMTGANKEAAVLAAQITGGNILNERLFKMALPHLPAGTGMFLNNPAGKALLANAFAAGLVHFLPQNEKAAMASGMMVQSAMIELAGTFNIEEMVDEFLDGVKLPGMNPKAVKTPDVDLTGLDLDGECETKA